MHFHEDIWVVMTILNAATTAQGLAGKVCMDSIINCQCGNPGYSFPVALKQCPTIYRWKMSCKPCNRGSIFHLCGNYRNCLDCDIGKCTRCPPGKFGTWCTGTCQCQNNAKCRKSDGKCICTPGFRGQSCLHQITFEAITTTASTTADTTIARISCPAPEQIENGKLKFRNNNSQIPLVGTQIQYSCHTNYVIMGNTISTCTQYGNWTSPAPLCIEAQNLTSLFDAFDI